MIRTNISAPAVMKFPKFKKANLLEKLSWQLLPHLCSLTHKWEKPLHLTRLIITKLRISTEHLILNQKVRMSKLLTYFQMVLIQSMTEHQSSLKSKSWNRLIQKRLWLWHQSAGVKKLVVLQKLKVMQLIQVHQKLLDLVRSKRALHLALLVTHKQKRKILSRQWERCISNKNN